MGFDACKDQIHGCNALKKAISRFSLGRGELIHGCAEDLLNGWPRNSVDVILSSPPYYDTERYSDESSQSYLRYGSYEEWRAGFLEAVLQECYRVLKNGCYMAVNAANVTSYPIADDVASIGRRVFGSRPATIKMLMAHLPAHRAARGLDAFKWEPILIFRK
jgi:DNA modification methylase